MVKKARADKLPVHDLSIKKWALSKAREVKLASFTALHPWIAEFKKLNRIVDRKITKFTCAKPS